MRFFDDASYERTKVTECIVIMDTKEANVIYEAMKEYVNNNKKKVIAKKVLKQMTEEWSIF